MAPREMLERVMGIEPTLVAWEATVLPLNYTRIVSHCIPASKKFANQAGWGPGAERFLEAEGVRAWGTR